MEEEEDAEEAEDEESADPRQAVLPRSSERPREFGVLTAEPVAAKDAGGVDEDADSAPPAMIGTERPSMPPLPPRGVLPFPLPPLPLPLPPPLPSPRSERPTGATPLARGRRAGDGGGMVIGMGARRIIGAVLTGAEDEAEAEDAEGASDEDDDEAAAAEAATVSAGAGAGVEGAKDAPPPPSLLPAWPVGGVRETYQPHSGDRYALFVAPGSASARALDDIVSPSGDASRDTGVVTPAFDCLPGVAPATVVVRGLRAADEGAAALTPGGGRRSTTASETVSGRASAASALAPVGGVTMPLWSSPKSRSASAESERPGNSSRGPLPLADAAAATASTPSSSPASSGPLRGPSRPAFFLLSAPLEPPVPARRRPAPRGLESPPSRFVAAEPPATVLVVSAPPRSSAQETRGPSPVPRRGAPPSSPSPPPSSLPSSAPGEA